MSQVRGGDITCAVHHVGANYQFLTSSTHQIPVQVLSTNLSYLLSVGNTERHQWIPSWLPCALITSLPLVFYHLPRSRFLFPSLAFYFPLRKGSRKLQALINYVLYLFPYIELNKLYFSPKNFFVCLYWLYIYYKILKYVLY